MPNVREQKFKASVIVPLAHAQMVEKYLEEHIGGRTYYLHSRHGSKHWAIEWNNDGNIVVHLDDEQLATFITLRYS